MVTRRFGMTRRKTFFFALFGAFLLSAGITSRSYAAFGISPPFLTADHLVPGVTYTQTIYLTQDNPSSDLPIKTTLTVSDHIRSWITIDKGFDFTIPQGTRQFPVQVSITVPKGEGLGTYSGNMVFATNPGASGQVTIALAANVAVSITVGNGIFEDYSVPEITFPSIEEGWNPRAAVTFKNSGNVSEALDGATFEVYDQFDAVRLDYIQKQSGFPDTPAFTQKEYALEFPTDFHLGIGDYWGIVTLYKKDQPVATQKGIFHVLPAGSLSSPWEIALASARNNWFYYLAGLIVLAFTPMFVRRKKSRRAKK